MITSHQHSILLLTGFTMSQQYEDFIITAIIIQIFHLEKKKKKERKKETKPEVSLIIQTIRGKTG
jgi:hypothetical protein